MRRVGPSIAVVVLTTLLLVYSLRLWRADVTVPFVNPGEGDTAYELAVAKGIIDTGWHTHTPRASAPGELDNTDFPRPDSLHFLLWRLCGMVMPNPAFVFNAVGFLSYPLAALTMFLVLRHLGISNLVAIAFGMLYAFLPYHMARWIAGHMLLVMYYTVPLMSLLALQILAGDVPFFRRDDTGRYRLQFGNLRTLCALGLALWAGSTSVYYAFFGCFFLVVAGGIATLRTGRFAPLVSAFLVAGICGATMTVNTLPNRRYVQENGLNCVVASRVPEEADIYGLRVAQLLLPRPQHRLDAFEYLRTRYEGRGIPEGANNALGVLGSIGMLYLLGLFLVRRQNDTREHLALLLLAGILLATIGAFGSLFNFLINADIRAYNRIVVYLAFFAFTATAMLVDRWLQAKTPLGRLRPHPFGPRGRFVVCVLVVAFGYWDQTSGKVPGYERNATKYHARETFVRDLEADLPPGAMIFQLPFMPYTESGPIHQMPDYSPALCYVHSTHTRWTYPAFSNRRWARWQEWVSLQPPAELVRLLQTAGFHGLHLDTRGYTNGGRELLAALQPLLGEPRRSADGTFVFFRLTPTPTAETAPLLERPYYSFQAGFRMGSKYREGIYLSAVRSNIAIGNPAAHTKKLRLGFTITRYSDRAGNLHVRGLDRDWTIIIQPKATRFEWELEVPPGQHSLHFELETSGTLSVMPNRLTEVWQVEQVTLDEVSR